MNANTLVYMGVALVVAGLLWKAGWLSWFGNLPGDIKYRSEHSFVFIPVTSMIIVSFLVSFVLWLFGRQ